MELIALEVEKRTTTGDGPAKAMRRDGFVPGIVYGPNTEPIMIKAPAKELEKAVRQSTLSQVLLNLTIVNGDSDTKPVMLKELQVHPLYRKPLHVDFLEILMDKALRIMVPINVVGKSIGVERGGIHQLVRREIEILCLPKDIPDSIDVDITEIDIGDSIHVSNLILPDDVTVVADVDFTIVTVVSPVAEEEPETEEGEEGEEGEEESTEEEKS